MILNHIAQCTRMFIIPGAILYSERFRCSNLDVIDVVRVPEGREDRICKAQHKNVLRCFLPQKVIDCAKFFQTSSRTVCREKLRVASSRSRRNSSSVFGRRAKPTISTAGGRSPSAARLYNAGTSLRWVRSPVAPNITIVHGCGTARADKPSRSGFGSG